MATEQLHKNDVNNICIISDIMPYCCTTLRDVVLQFASFLKGKDTHHICPFTVFTMPCFYKLQLNRHFYTFITAHALKLVQYGQLNTVIMVIFVSIFVTMDMQPLYIQLQSQTYIIQMNYST